MKTTVFLMCHSEQVLIARTIHHYRTLLPGCEIVICDNESTDRSAQIAKELGCHVHSFATGKTLNEFVMLGIRNNVWKHVRDGWVIMCDMDEYLCVDERQLSEEAERGTTVLTTRGFEIVGNSESADLDDVDITLYDKGYFSEWYSKKACFRRDAVVEMNYEHGCHKCWPTGRITFSKVEYPLYHMNFLGLPYFVRKYRQRYERSHEMRRYGIATHYSDDETVLTNRFRSKAARCQSVPTLANVYGRVAS